MLLWSWSLHADSRKKKLLHSDCGSRYCATTRPCFGDIEYCPASRVRGTADAAMESFFRSLEAERMY